MTGWPEFALALSVFLGSHFLPRIGGLRDKIIARVGRRTYFSAYGALSLALLFWVIAAAARAPYLAVWPTLPWTVWVPNVVMPVAILLASCGVGMSHPFTLGGRPGSRFRSEAPGFAAVCRHPLLLALGLWALAHLAPNGDVAHVILFGCFALLAFAAIPLFDLWARKILGPEPARAYFESTSVFSLAPFANPVWRGAMTRTLLRRGGIAVLLWAALLHLHSLATGASPFPF